MQKERIDAGFVGCGGHATRNVFPALQFAPVNLVATADLIEERAKQAARRFGAERFYTDHREMLDKEKLDALFIVTNYDAAGRPRYPRLAIDALDSGCHVWMEKPPASSTDEVRQMMKARDQAGRYVVVGFKKCFTPAVSRVKEITGREEFGRIRTVYTRYPLGIPRVTDELASGRTPRRSFLDHIVHPMSIVQYIGGPAETLYYEREESGGGFGVLELKSGAVACLHFAAGHSGTSPLERLEVIGDRANVVVDNGVKLTYYRPGSRGSGGYGKSTDYIGDDSAAPIYWEPEWSLGQLYNKQLFLLGYSPEVSHFAECILPGKPPTKGTLEDALEILKVFEAFYKPPRQLIQIK